MSARAREAAPVLAVHVPLAGLAIALKAIRARTELGPGHSLLLLDLVRPELFFYAASAAAWAAVWLLLPKRRRPLLYLLAAWVVTAAILELSAHNFYVGTGELLDASLLGFFLDYFHSMLPVVFWPLLLTLAVAPVLAGAFWWLVGRRTKGAGTTELVPVRPAATLAGVSLIAIAGAFLGPLGPVDREFAAPAPLFLFESGLRDALAVQPKGTAPAPRRLAIDGARKKNVVMIFLESTRASATTLGNPSLATTPALAALAAKSVSTSRAYAIVPHTSKALVSMLCGDEPDLRLGITEAKPEGLPLRCLPKLLRDAGYASAFFQPSTRSFEERDGLTKNLGFDDFFSLENIPTKGFEQTNYFGVEEAALAGPSHDWLAAHRDKPFFAAYLTLSSHHDYRPPHRYGIEHFSDDDLLNRYLNGVRAGDFLVKTVLDQLAELGLDRDTVVVVVGDHGQAFGEHHRWQHGGAIYEEGIRVPLVMFDPDAPVARPVDGPVSQLDILPTLAEMLGARIDGPPLGGVSLLHPVPKDRVVYTSCWYERRCMARIDGARKLVDHFGARPDELFDVVADPGEKKDLAPAFPDEVAKDRADLYAWRAKVESRWP